MQLRVNLLAMKISLEGVKRKHSQLDQLAWDPEIYYLCPELLLSLLVMRLALER